MGCQIFTVEPWGKGWIVDGEMSVAGRIACEQYRRYFTSRKKAEADASRMEAIERQARTEISEAIAARKAEAMAIRADRAARRERERDQQLSLPL